ncbi:hypothetical protein GGF42_006637 [Coemansia sp. RSA 2424]|nr:hypothetical protein GGF42_006637 [Coemansia sp. RSA 2424]
MDEQYRQWRRRVLDSSQGDDDVQQHRRLSYEDFKASVMQGDDGGRLLDYVNSKVIFQAGVDFESRPMVVFSASGLPSPSKVDYDRLLNLIIFRLDQFVESDYTVVMLTSGAQHNPSWNWLTKAYRRLDRKYRKNVKRVYVVHPSTWSKVVFQIFGKIVSPKFFAKVTWVDTLSQLATMVPLSQISIPAPVSEHNAKVDAGARAGGGEGALLAPPPLNESLAFGVPLAVLMRGGGGNHVVLPRPVRECIAFLRRHGTATEGVFRRSPPSTALRAAKAAYNGGQAVDLSLGGGVHVAAVLLKLFFRELPVPVFGGGNDSDYAVVRALPVAGKSDGSPQTDQADQQMDDLRARYVADVILPQLARETRLLLCFTAALLACVARNAATTRMTAFNLAVVWAPNLARSASPVADVAMCCAGPGAASVGAVVQIMVSSFDSVFAAELPAILGSAGFSGGDGDCVEAVLDVVDRMNQEGDGFAGLEISSSSPSPPPPPPPLPPRAEAFGSASR